MTRDVVPSRTQVGQPWLATTTATSGRVSSRPSGGYSASSTSRSFRACLIEERIEREITTATAYGVRNRDATIYWAIGLFSFAVIGTGMALVPEALVQEDDPLTTEDESLLRNEIDGAGAATAALSVVGAGIVLWN